MASGSGARADEVVPQSADWLTSIIFILAVLALTLVTLGVLYLSLTSWLDKRTENKDRARLAQSEKDRKLQALGVTPRPRKKVSDAPTRGGGKGFGN
ncbi:hypothetical protein WJX81_005777 [Elliptochloris bilobata]|uniref:Uncharacterized protein n=1 Tax=Elliptochloris bilobata TaxID=381761 RepID=A0AAW1SGJ9_9CHLO